MPSFTQQMLESLQSTFDIRELLLLAGGLSGLGALQALQTLRRPKLAHGRFAKGRERAHARRVALKQMQQSSAHSLAVALTVGTPRHRTDRSRLYIPDANRGIGIIGGPGSGKTYSAVNPLIRSALEQGIPAIVYDYKFPAQTQELAAYAEHLGYDVYLFAPGFPESSVVCNPLDFLENAEDSTMALQLAKVMHENFRPSRTQVGDAFFEATGQNLVQAMLQLVKETPYPDLMLINSILGLSQLAERLEAAKGMNPWTYAAFSTIRSVKESEKTASSITGTASATFSNFMHPALLGSFCGETTCPIQLEGKTLLILGMKQDYS